jgi:hypothetical protein
VTNASVVSKRPAMDAAFCNALRVTLVDRRSPPSPDRYSSAATSAFVAFALLHFLDHERAFLARVVGELR